MTEDRGGGEACPGALLALADPREDRLRIRTARELDELAPQVLLKGRARPPPPARFGSWVE